MDQTGFGKRAARIALVTFFTLTCFLVTRAHSQPANMVSSDKLIKLAADPWCPYNCLPSEQHRGYMIDIAAQVFAEAGFRVRYEVMPWSRALREVHDNRIDGAVGATHQNGRGLVFGREPLGVDHTVIALRAGAELEYRGPRSLDTLRIGVISNYGYDNGGPIDKYLYNRARSSPDSIFVISTAQALPQLVRMLLREHIDAVLANSNVLAYTLKSMGTIAKVKVVDTNAYDSVWIAFSRTERGRFLARLLDRGLLRLRKDGSLNRILSTYGLSDWQPDLTRVRKTPPEIPFMKSPVL